MLSKKGWINIIERIFDTGGATDDMLKDLERLKADFAERQAILDKYGEAYDGNDDEYVYKIKDDRDYKADYEALKERYVQRFLHDTDEYEDEDEDEDEPKKREYDDLFVKEDN